MPFYNGQDYVIETVESIISQTFTDWQLIIVDDCSTDDHSKSLLQRLKGMDPRISVLFADENKGAGAARNIGIDYANTRFIAFCDSDDWWYPEKLSKQISFMKDNGYSFVCSYYEDADENLSPYYTTRQPLKMTLKDLKYGCSVGTPGVIYDSFSLGKVFMPEMRRGEDWICWMEILKKSNALHTYPEPLWKYRHRRRSETSNKLAMVKTVMKVYQYALGYSTIKSIVVLLLFFLPKNILKKLRKLQ